MVYQKVICRCLHLFAVYIHVVWPSYIRNIKKKRASYPYGFLILETNLPHLKKLCIFIQPPILREPGSFFLKGQKQLFYTSWFHAAHLSNWIYNLMKTTCTSSWIHPFQGILQKKQLPGLKKNLAARRQHLNFACFLH